MRLFVAIPVEGAARAEMERFSEGLEGRVVDPDHWHITLAFLDDRPEEVAEEVALMLGAIEVFPFIWRVSGAGVFGGNQPRNVHAAIDPSEQLAGLRDRVRRAVRQSGVTLRQERFVPHVTLARFNARLPGVGLDRWLAQRAAVTLGPFPAERFVLYSSELTAEGPVYTELVEYPLALDHTIL